MRKADMMVYGIGLTGECNRRQLELLAGGRYVERLITELVKEKLIRRKTKNGLSGYRLTKKGYERYERMFGVPPVPLTTVQREVSVKKRERMQRNAYGFVMAQRSGAVIREGNPLTDDRDGYYPLIFYQDAVNSDMHSSRASGYLAWRGTGCLVYDLMGQDIIFRRGIEERTVAAHDRKKIKMGKGNLISALFLSDDFSVADKILSRGSSGGGKSRIGLEPYFSHMYYYPHTADGFTQLKFLLYPERIRKLKKELRSLIVSKAGSYAAMEGLDEEGAEIYFLFAPDLKKMGRMRAEIIPERKSRIFTLSFLAEFVGRHFPHSEVFPFDEAKLPE